MCSCFQGDRQLQNVILLSISFMFIFTAFQTMGNIEETILSSIRKDDPNFKGDGYTSLAVIYSVFAAATWLSPSVVILLNAKLTMIIGGVIYSLFIASFLYPHTWMLYGISGVLGFGAAILWTAQGNYLTQSSNQQTISRNSGIFWAILQCSMFLGNSFVFWQFEGKSEIDSDTRTLVFSVLTALSVVGIFCLLLLRKPIEENEGDTENLISVPSNRLGDATSIFSSSVALFKKKEMLLLSFTFFYTGMELSFFSGVYSATIGFTDGLGKEAKRLVGLCGILVGAGEVLGGALFGILGSRTVKQGRDPIVLLGFLSHIITFFLIYLNIPNAAPLGKTTDHAFINPPSATIAMICAFFLGFGDSCYNTQLYSIIGGIFSEVSVSAFALFKFTQSLAAAASFFYSSQFDLHIQLLLLSSFCFIGTLTFVYVEWKYGKVQNNSIEDRSENEVINEVIN